MNVKTLKPIYLIYSEQKFLINEALKRLKSQITNQSLGDLNVVEFSAPLDFEELEMALHTAGFFEQKKAVIVNQADKLTQAQIQKLDQYRQQSNPDVTLVLVALKKNEILFRQARLNKYFYEYKSPKRGQLAQWIIDYFNKEGRSVNLETASYLINSIGNDLSFLANEIDKIILYCATKQKLTIDDIKAVVSNQTHETIFDLVDALGQADLPLALSYLNHLFNTENEGRIFGMIVRQFRLLLKTKGLLAEDMNSSGVAKVLRLPPFVASKYMKQASHFSTSKLVLAHSILLETDVKQKTSGAQLSKELELALIKILAA